MDAPVVSDGVTHASGAQPIQAQQVSQFLLARNYYLTALEFLVESIEHGYGSDVTSLQEFFNDAEKFPTHELSRYQNHNALDVQARSKEREERMQLLEYELRLSKEDVADLKAQLLQTQQALATQLDTHRVQLQEATAPDLSAGDTGSEHCKSTRSGFKTQQTVWGGPAEPLSTQLQDINAAIAAHLLSQGYKVTALSLQEEADVSASWQPASGNPLWEWYCQAQNAQHSSNLDGPRSHHAAGNGLDTTSSSDSIPSPTSSSPGSLAEEEQNLRQQLQTTQSQLRELQEKLKSLEAATEQPLLQKQDVDKTVDVAVQPGVALKQPSHAESQLPPAPSMDYSDDSGDDTDHDRGKTQLHRQSSKAASQLVPSLGDSAEAVLAGVDFMHLVTDLLPRISSNLTMKSRQELLPLLQVVVQHHPSLQARQAHLLLLFNLVPSPDLAQREAIILSFVELTKVLGPEWASAELLPLCMKSLSNQSAERRAMCVELTSALLPLVDLRSQFETIMAILLRLVDDRIPGVRESVAATAARLLEHLPFLRHCFTSIEDLLFEFMKDTEESVANAVMRKFVPALLHWLQPTELVSTQLLPRTLSTLHSLLRSPPTARPTHRRRSTHGSIDFSADEELLLFNAGKPPPLEGHYLQACQLVQLFQLQLPHLADTVLRTAPAWAYGSAKLQSGVPVIVGTVKEESQFTLVVEVADDPQEDRHPLAPMSSNTPAESPASAATMSAIFSSGQLSNPGFGNSSPTRAPKASEPSHLNISSNANISASPRDAIGIDDQSVVDMSTWLNVGEQWRMWRVLSWCMQTMLPQLTLVMQMLAASQEVLQLRLKLADALRDTCKMLGSELTSKAVAPMMAVAAASTCPPPIQGPTPAPCQPPPCSISWSSIPRHVQELSSQLAPATEDEVEEARQRVLPFLLGVVLPEAGPGMLQSFAQHLMEPESPSNESCWALEHRVDMKLALRFAAGFPAACSELLELLSQLVHCGSMPQTLCAVVLAHALAACVPARVLSQSVLPALMTLLGAGDREVKSASISALGDVSRQLSIAPPDGDTQVATSCQQKIRAIFDHLLQDGGHELQLCVLRTLSKVTTLDERLAGNGMLAQLEYLMQKLQFLLVQMQVSLPQQRTPEELCTLASLLLCILQGTFACECKDPKTQAYMSAAFQSMQTQRHLLDESQQESLSAMAQAQGSVAAPAYTSLQPNNVPTPVVPVPPLPTGGIASQRPHDPLNAPEVLKNVGAVVGNTLVSRWKSGWRGSKATAATAAVAEVNTKNAPQGVDHFFDE